MFTAYDKLGGEDQAVEVIARRTGKVPTTSAVRSWRDNRRIPGKIALVLIEEMHARGLSYAPDDFVSAKPKRHRGAA